MNNYGMVDNNMVILHTLFLVIAIYFSFKRNNGFSLLSFIVAVLLPELYIIYVLATQNDLSSLLPGRQTEQYIDY